MNTLGRNQKQGKSLFWLLITFLSVVNVIPIFIGFHPHHDGLMLATIRLLKESLLGNGSYMFNQYGSFWTLPYLFISFFVPDNLLLFFMRVLTFCMSALTLFFTYKIGLLQFNKSVARISVLIVLISRPIGLEPIPWPSTLGMLLVVLLTYVVLLAQSKSETRHTEVLLFIASFASVGLVFTRVQIGVISICAVILYLLLTKSKKIFFYLSSSVLLFAIYCLILHSFGWLQDSIKDEFLFGWVVASSDLTDRTFPRVSILILVGLGFLNFMIARLSYAYAKFGLLFSTFIFALFFTVLSYSRTEFVTSLYGKFWVGVLFFGFGLSLYQGIRDFNFKKFDNFFLISMSIASASQIYPLFDSMHAWWGLTPIAVLLAEWASNSIHRLRLSSLVKNLVIVIVSFSFILPFSSSLLESNYSQVSGTDLSLIFTDQDYAELYQSESDLLYSNMIANGSVLNLCPDGRVFFGEDHPRSSSRYFVYWATMANQNDINRDILESNPDFVVLCTDVANYLPNELNERFTNAPYTVVAKFDEARPFVVYGKER